MKYTDRFFKFPVRVTDAYVAESLEKSNEKISLPTIDSYIKLPYSEIEGWQEMYPPETEFDEVSTKGFECTLVFTKKHRDILCSWNVKKFESKLDAYVSELEEFVKNSNSNSIQKTQS